MSQSCAPHLPDSLPGFWQLSLSCLPLSFLCDSVWSKQRLFSCNRRFRVLRKLTNQIYKTFLKIPVHPNPRYLQTAVAQTVCSFLHFFGKVELKENFILRIIESKINFAKGAIPFVRPFSHQVFPAMRCCLPNLHDDPRRHKHITQAGWDESFFSLLFLVRKLKVQTEPIQAKDLYERGEKLDKGF